MILDGIATAKTIEKRIEEAISKIQGRKPALAFIRVGENPASIAYIHRKKKKCKEVGIVSIDLELDERIDQATLLEKIDQLNRDDAIDGILVQLPLPSHIHTETILESIAVEKDVDGFHPFNMGKLLLGDRSGFTSCTPYGIMILLHHAGIDPAGKHVVIVGRSNIVGKPLAALLVQKQEGANATVTIAHSRSENLKALTQSGDIVVVAMGKPHFLKADMVKPGAVVIDVGINRLDGKIVGDVDFEEVKQVCRAITPVPGGVGPMTIAMLLSNTLLAYERNA